MLVVEQLSFEVAEKIFSNINFKLKPHNIYGLCGINGSGKTTLLRIISGLVPKKSGTIFFQQDKETITTDNAKKNFFYYETTNWFNDNLTAKDYLLFVNKEWNSGKSDINNIAHFWNIQSFIKLPIRKYSLGMKQRLLLSLYEASGTSYWLMDEPTIGLDADSLALFKQKINVEKNKGKSILFSTHCMDEVVSEVDRILEVGNNTVTFRDERRE